MIETQLILIEGIPGSGKSTTAEYLAQQIKNQGHECHCFLEWDTHHPIFIGYEEELVDTVSSFPRYFPTLLSKWEHFAEDVQSEGTVNVIESRFWQTGVMFLHAAGQTEDDVVERHQRIIEVIEPLKPVLIYLTHDNTREALVRTFQLRDAAWEQWMLGIIEQLSEVRKRGLKGREGWFTFFEEWVLLAEKLYRHIPFRKIKIQNPHADWDLTYQQIAGFLGLA